MKKVCLLFILVSISLSSMFAVATVKDFFGKVKIKYDGDTKWSRITVGMELPANATVSTGFNSQIVLDLGNATLDVLPLTRMTISEITESNDTINTSLFLQGGKIIADVKKIEGKVNDFKIKSPVATASVRGTAFEFSGNSLKVIRGLVGFAPTKKANDDSEKGSAGVAVGAGGSTQMASPNSIPVSPKAMANKMRTIEASTKPAVVKLLAGALISGLTEQTDVPSPGDVADITDDLANITITINPIED